MRLGLIVEGQGEVEATPVLIRRLADWIAPGLVVEVVKPFRLPRGKMLQPAELARAVTFVASSAGPQAPILILLDADDDAACRLGPKLLEQAREAHSDRAISVVVAEREYEAWFLAGATSLSGHRGLPDPLESLAAPEQLRDAKGWLGARMPNGYSATVDQAALSHRLDLAAARRAGSFDKLVRDLARLLDRPPPPLSG